MTTTNEPVQLWATDRDSAKAAALAQVLAWSGVETADVASAERWVSPLRDVPDTRNGDGGREYQWRVVLAVTWRESPPLTLGLGEDA